MISEWGGLAADRGGGYEGRVAKKCRLKISANMDRRADKWGDLGKDMEVRR